MHAGTRHEGVCRLYSALELHVEYCISASIDIRVKARQTNTNGTCTVFDDVVDFFFKTQGTWNLIRALDIWHLVLCLT